MFAIVINAIALAVISTKLVETVTVIGTNLIAEVIVGMFIFFSRWKE